jgi:hypothetical protein
MERENYYGVPLESRNFGIPESSSPVYFPEWIWEEGKLTQSMSLSCLSGPLSCRGPSWNISTMRSRPVCLNSVNAAQSDFKFGD